MLARLRRISLFVVIFFLFLISPSITNACNELATSPSSPQQGESVTLSASGCTLGFAGGYTVFLIRPDGQSGVVSAGPEVVDNSFSVNLGAYPQTGTYTVEIYNNLNLITSTTFAVVEDEEGLIEDEATFYSCGQIVPAGTGTCSDSLNANCCPSFCPAQAADEVGSFVCKSQDRVPVCATGGGLDEGFPTALGCIPFSSVTKFTIAATNILGGFGGAIAFLVVVAAGFLFMTSQANPEKVSQSSQMVAAAIAGLFLIVFGIILYRIVAINVLGLF